MLALQTLGKKMAMLPNGQFESLVFTGMQDLRDAIAFFRNLSPKNHEARRRQMQFIGKMMRHADIEALTEQIKRIEAPDYQEKRAYQQAEHWCKDLIDHPERLSTFLEQFNCDSQRLSSLIHATRKAKSANIDRGEARALLRTIQVLIKH